MREETLDVQRIRDAEENREIPNFNGFYRGYDPSAWAHMTLTSINAPIRIGRATVLPGDLVLAKTDGVDPEAQRDVSDLASRVRRRDLGRL